MSQILGLNVEDAYSIMQMLHQRVNRLEINAQGVQNGRCAYVTLVMRGDFYVPGAIVLAHSLRKAGAMHELVVMVTSDVGPAARKALQCVFDRVVDVAVISAKHAPLSTAKIEGMYHKWMDDSFTLFRCLGLVEYDKVCLLDSDIVALRNMDDVFDLPAPAGCFHSFWVSNLARHDPYPRDMCQGDKVSSSVVERALTMHKSFVCIGNCLILEPSAEASMELDKYIADSVKRKGYVGFLDVYSASTEQVIADFYAQWMQQEWTHMSTQYNCIPWKHKPHEGPPYLFHYFHLKPWAAAVLQYPDLVVWWAAGADACRKHPELEKWVFNGRKEEIMSASATKWRDGKCIWCKGAHNFIDFEQNQIMCPEILKGNMGGAYKPNDCCGSSKCMCSAVSDVCAVCSNPACASQVCVAARSLH